NSTHTYAEEGTFTVTIAITDDSGSSTSIHVTATVSDAPRHADGVAVLAVEGAQFSGTVATFTDDGSPEAPANYTATIHWGDNSLTSGTISASNGAFSVKGTHTYAEEGAFTIAIAINDDGGSSISIHANATVSDAP